MIVSYMANRYRCSHKSAVIDKAAITKTGGIPHGKKAGTTENRQSKIMFTDVRYQREEAVMGRALSKSLLFLHLAENSTRVQSQTPGMAIMTQNGDKLREKAS